MSLFRSDFEVLTLLIFFLPIEILLAIMNSILQIMKIICFLSLHTADSNPEVCKG